MGVTVLFYKLFQFKADSAAMLKRYFCPGNITYKFILTTVRLLTCSAFRTYLTAAKNNYFLDILFKLSIFRFY